MAMGSSSTDKEAAALAAANAAALEAAKRHRIQRQLDDALADSFPASDPVSIVTSQREESWEDDEKNPSEK